jgi:hypothetical protein
VASGAHVTSQSPEHLTSQLAVSLHATELPPPRSSLQSASAEHVAVELAPALSSHLVVPLQVIWLPSPPLALHSELSLHVSDTAAVPLALHLLALSQDRAHADPPHSSLQSVPAEQVQVPGAAQLQPVPVHVPSPAPPPPPVAPSVVSLSSLQPASSHTAATIITWTFMSGALLLGRLSAFAAVAPSGTCISKSVYLGSSGTAGAREGTPFARSLVDRNPNVEWL